MSVGHPNHLFSGVFGERGCNNAQCKIRRSHHFHPPGQHDPLVVDGEQQRAVVLGRPQPRPHVTADPFAMRHGRPSHRVEPVDGHDSVERFVARGQRPEREVLRAVRVQEPAPNESLFTTGPGCRVVGPRSSH